MRRRRIVAALAALMLGALIIPGQWQPVSAVGSNASAAKKVCKTVTKKVHGKKKKVKVCHTVKATPTPTPTDTPTLTPTATSTPLVAADEAKALAAEVGAATTADARKSALIDVMRALHIGVYNWQTGNAIVRGAETGPRDFYLYDFELVSLAGGLDRGEMHSLADLAALLTAVGIQPNGQPVDPEDLRGLLVDGVQGATQHPSDNLALLPLIVRDLGLRHDTPYDLAQNPAAGTIQLDALQFFLVGADLLAPIITKASTSGNSTGVMLSRLAPQLSPCKAIPYLIQPANPNTYFESLLHYVADESAASGVSTLANLFGTEIGEAAEAAALPDLVLKALHGMLLAYSLKIESQPPLQQDTHYGPPGHAADAGKQLVFKALVTMQDDLGQAVVLCLNELGYKVPNKGPVPGVNVNWHDAEGTLEQYGTVQFDNPSSIGDQTTGACPSPNCGVATMTFTPKTEKLPGFGEFITKSGAVVPRLLWGTAFENLFGTINQLISPKLGDNLNWTVTYHKPRGFKFAATFVQTAGNGLIITDTLRGRVCGDRPWTTWPLQWTRTVVTPYTSSTDSGTADVSIPDGGQGTAVIGTTTGIGFTVVPGPPAVMQVRDPTVPGYSISPSESQGVSLAEDTTCPDNSGSG